MTQYFDCFYEESSKQDPQNVSEFSFFNDCFDKNQVKLLVSWFLSNYGEKKTIDFLEKLKYMGFHNATQAGISLGLEDLEIPPDKSILISEATAEMNEIGRQSLAGALTSVEKSQSLIDTWNQTSELLRQNAVQNFKNKNCVNPVYMMAFSGARGNISQVRQLVAMRGLMADPQGAILEFPIQSNFREGLTITEYLISCYGARKGLVDTALRTATSGYLTRRLVDSAQHAVIAMNDCNTQFGIKLFGKNLESRLIGRVLLNSVHLSKDLIFNRNHLISVESGKILASSTNEIFIRSPLTCEAQTTVCKMCYGSNLATGKLVTIGETVGVIAAQSIGEPGTQLTMRTFHTGGVGVFSDQAIKPIFAPYNGKIEFLENLSGHFVRTPYGNIRYMVKYISKDPNRILARIKPIGSDLENWKNNTFTIYESDLPSGSLLVVKQGEIVKPQQLLAQASQLKLTKQKFPESSHPVYSPVEGQVFFESMNVNIQKENLLFSDLAQKDPRTDYSDYLCDLDNLRANSLINPGLPDIRTMSKIGSFWILSSHNQSEVHSAESFLVAGDLITPKGLLFQYNFYSAGQQQLKTLNKHLVLGSTGFQISLSRTNYNCGFYKFKSSFSDTVLYKSIGKTQKISSRAIQDPKNSDVGFELEGPGFFWYIPLFSSKNEKLIYTYFLLEYLNPEIQANKISDKLISTYNTNNLKKIQGNVFTLKQNIKIFSDFLKNGNTAVLPSLKFSNLHKEFYLYKRGKCSLIKYQELKQQLNRKTYSVTFQINPSFQPGKTFSKLNGNSGEPSFVKNSIKHILENFFPLKFSIYQQNKPGWVYLPLGLTTKLGQTNSKIGKSQLISKKFSKPNSVINEISIPKSYCSLEFLPVNYFLTKQVKNYSLGEFQRKTLYQVEKLINCTKILEIQESANRKPFYRLRKTKNTIWFKNNKFKSLSTSKVKFNNNFLLKNTGQNPSVLLNFSLVTESQLMTSKSVKKRWSQLISKETTFNPTNPLFSKQYSTKLVEFQPKVVNFQIQMPQNSTWVFSKSFMRLELQIPKDSIFAIKKTVLKYGSGTNYFNLGFTLFSYRQLIFNYSNKFKFQTFSNNWILPICQFTQGYIPIQSFGEFQALDYKLNGTSTSILTINNIRTLKFNEQIPWSNNQVRPIGNIKIGKMLRWGDELFSDSLLNENNPGIGSPINGQIIKIEKKTITVRLGTPFLASNRGIIHIFQNELVQKNQLLVTLKSRRLQTEDIVQGIPKIEQLFEARESQSGQILHDTVHMRLKNFFILQLENLGKNHWSVAVQKSFLQAQQFLVEEIVEAYGKQGVKISEKHVEVIVRQMTSRVRILSGGETGLLPGELVDHQWIQIFNKQLKEIGLREATYEPVVLGISKSVLQSDSFLLAASFQEVSRVLVKSALSKKRDFLRGLHENVIVGQIIPAGTGLLGQNHFNPQTKLLNLNSIELKNQLF